jgi:hypothetical protein
MQTNCGRGDEIPHASEKAGSLTKLTRILLLNKVCRAVLLTMASNSNKVLNAFDSIHARKRQPNRRKVVTGQTG